MNYINFLLELNNIGRGVSASNTYTDHEGTFCFYVQVAGKGKRGMFHKMECVVKDLDIKLDEFFLIIKKDAINRFVGNKVLEEITIDDVEADVKTTISPKSGNASIGRKIGKKYPGQKLRIIVLKGSEST